MLPSVSSMLMDKECRQMHATDNGFIKKYTHKKEFENDDSKSCSEVTNSGLLLSNRPKPQSVELQESPESREVFPL